MDSRTGDTYPTREDALKAGVPERDIVTLDGPLRATRRVVRRVRMVARDLRQKRRAKKKAQKQKRKGNR